MDQSPAPYTSKPAAGLSSGPPRYDVIREAITGLIALLVVAADMYGHVFNHAASISVVDALATLAIGFYFGRGVQTTSSGGAAQ